MAKIFSPNEKYSGVSASVTFVEGQGETDNPDLIIWFKENGYQVVEDEASEPETGEPCAEVSEPETGEVTDEVSEPAKVEEPKAVEAEKVEEPKAVEAEKVEEPKAKAKK